MKAIIAATGALTLAFSAVAGDAQPLRVCADPNNMPFSDRGGHGFENRIIELLARDLHRQVEYVWWAQRRGFVRHTLGEAACDLWPGLASGMDDTATSQPYYESTYVFVTRADRDLRGLSLDDPRLKGLSIGVQMIGADGMNTPPVHALARRGIIGNVRGFMLYGDYRQPNPPARIIDAVASGAVDVALAWGPLAGYFAATASRPLRVQPMAPSADGAGWPMHFAISMGVAAHSSVPLTRINALLQQERPRIQSILRQYHVPLVAGTTP